MCGVFGVVGTDNNAGERVLSGLRQLEYRGYDSWGITTRSDTALHTQKRVGKISEAKPTFKPVSIALGHTRWATHGGVSKKNAHPHTHGRVTLVHNGVAENYHELQRSLPRSYTFTSETDSEILAALIDYSLSQHSSIKQAIRHAVKQIEGRFALVILIEGSPGMWIVRRGSPLIIGRDKSATYVASDIPAFLEYTKTVNYIDDNEYAYITRDEVCVWSITNGRSIAKRDITVDWNLEQATKDGWPHFMLKEILEQKETILRTLEHDSKAIKAFIGSMKRIKGSFIIGSGTAHKAAMVSEYWFAKIAMRKINVQQSEEMHVFKPFIKKGTAVLAVSQSGETADALEVLEYSSEHDATILSITNVPSSSIARMSRHHLAINTGTEKAVASTKALTAQMALLFLCAYADGPGMNRGRRLLQDTGVNINDLLNPRYIKHIETIAQELQFESDMFIIGRNALYPIALEAAIKIQEVSYIHAHGFAAGELKHGPIALIEKGTVCIVLGDDPETITNAVELRARGARIVGIAPTECAVFDRWIRVPDCGEAQPIATVIPTQLLAYYLAIARGVDPDMPRNLAKSVTVK